MNDPMLAKLLYTFPLKQKASRFLLLIFAAWTAALIYGSYGNMLFLHPQPFIYFEYFIKESLLFLLLAAIGWYYVLIKSPTAEIAELKFLYSLPLSHRQLGDFIMLRSLSRSSAMFALLMVLTFSLVRFAPLAHICRLNIILSIWYAIVTAITRAAFFASATSKRPSAAIRYYPLLVALAMLIFVIGDLMFVLQDAWIAGFSFFAVLLTLGVIMAAIVWWMRNRFEHYLDGNRLYAVPMLAHQKIEKRALPLPWRRLMPLLSKNLLKLARLKSSTGLLLTALFVASAYLLSKNNHRADDFQAVLMGMMLVYALGYSFRMQNDLSTTSEPIEQVFCLPLRKTEIYFSAMLPAAAWLLTVHLVLIALALLSFPGDNALMLMGLKSFIISLGFVSLSISMSMAAYPDGRKANRQFIWIILLLIIMTAVFYRFRYILFFTSVSCAIARLWPAKLYRTCQ